MHLSLNARIVGRGGLDSYFESDASDESPVVMTVDLSEMPKRRKQIVSLISEYVPRLKKVVEAENTIEHYASIVTSLVRVLYFLDTVYSEE
eukprot:tig00020553_g10720.t1